MLLADSRKSEQVVAAVLLACVLNVVPGIASAQDPPAQDPNAIPADPPAPDTPASQPAPNQAPVVGDSEDLPDFNYFKLSGISKREERLSESPMSAYVITREEMNRWGTRYLPEVLGRTPGFAFYNVDYYGLGSTVARGQYSLWRYGFSLELTPIFDFGDIKVPQYFFKTVETVRGPASLMWGNAATAGLVNFNVRDDLRGPEALFEIGNYGRREFAFMHGGVFANPKDTYFVGFSFEQQDPELKSNPWDQPGIWYTNGWRPSYALLARLQYNGFKALVMKSLGDKVIPHFSAIGSEELATAVKARTGRVMHDTLEVLVSRLEYHLPLQSLSSLTPILDDVDAFVFMNMYQKQWWTEAVAIDSQRRNSAGWALSGRLLERTVDVNVGGDVWAEESNFAPSTTYPWVHDAPYDIAWFDSNVAVQSARNHNIYGQLRYRPWRPVEVLAGGRVDWYTGAPATLTPRLAAFYYMDENTLTVKYLFNNAKRQPQASELVDAVGPLKPENLVSHELVALFHPTRSLAVETTVFYQRMVDQLNFVENTHYRNTGGNDAYGVELASSYSPIKPLLLYLNGYYMQMTQKQAADVANAVPGDPQGRPLTVPQASAFIGAEGTLLDLIKINLAARSINRIPYLDVAGNYKLHAGVVFVDLSVRAGFLGDKLHFGLYANNLLNNLTRLPAEGEHAQLLPGTLEPQGRRFYARLTVDW